MMRNIIFLSILFMVLTVRVMAQEVTIDSTYENWYYKQRMSYFEKMHTVKGAIVFLGNSITERADWHELLGNYRYPILNRGIGGDNSFGIRARMDEVLRGKPRAIFMMDGINDQFRKLPHAVSIANYRQIIRKIKALSPRTKIYLLSALPINEALTKEVYTKGRNVLVPTLNNSLEQLAKEENVQFVNIVPLFSDEQGNLSEQYTADGVHLKPVAYIKWVNFLKENNYL